MVRLTYATLDARLDALARSCDVALNLDGIEGRDGYPGVEVVEALAARGVPCTGAGREFPAGGGRPRRSPEHGCSRS